MVTGRFAPSPSGRMHLGNVYAALMSWLSARRAGGRWILRIEDLDPQRSRPEYARRIEDDLLWLGLEWDEGGIDAGYCQSLRHGYYRQAHACIEEQGLVYACRCTRADLQATQAPHASDGRLIYPGTCRPEGEPPFGRLEEGTSGAIRLYVPPGLTVRVTDRNLGTAEVDLAAEVGDFVLRRADGAWAYQLAVVVDDALMGVTEVVRGSDLWMPSTAQQAHLYHLLGYREPEWAHIPLVTNSRGERLSKRDSSLSLAELRGRGLSAAEVLGMAASMGGFISEPRPVTLDELLDMTTK